MRGGFTLVEVTVALVISAIALLSIPAIILKSEEAEGLYIDDDLLYKGAALAQDAASFLWDEEVNIQEGLGNGEAVVPVQAGDVRLNAVVAGRYRTGHFQADGRRCFYPVSGTARAITIQNRDVGANLVTSLNTLDGGWVKGGGGSGYENIFTVTFAVRYVADGVVRTGQTETATWSLTPEGVQGDGISAENSTNLKRVQIHAVRGETVYDLYYFASNIGSSRWGEK